MYLRSDGVYIYQLSPNYNNILNISLKRIWVNYTPLPSKMFDYTSLPSYVKSIYILPSPLIQNILEKIPLPSLREDWMTFPSPLMLKSTLYSLNIFFISNNLVKNNNQTHFGKKNSIVSLFKYNQNLNKYFLLFFIHIFINM